MTDPVFEALWKRVADAWEQDETHGAFLRHCQETGQLLEAAVRYRGMAGDRERGPDAERRLKAVALLAMAQLESSRAPSAQGTRHGRALWLVVFFVLGSAALLYYASILSGP
jgi:hypothetical protein